VFDADLTASIVDGFQFDGFQFDAWNFPEKFLGILEFLVRSGPRQSPKMEFKFNGKNEFEITLLEISLKVFK
jgi:hypothetical protein